MQEIKYATCGDSFASIDIREPQNLQWPFLVGSTLGFNNCNQLHLGRGAADNWYIFLQASWALKRCENLEHLIIWWTGPERFFVRHPDVEHELHDLQGICASEVFSHINTHENNFNYGSNEKKYISDTFSNVISGVGHSKDAVRYQRQRYNQFRPLQDSDWDILTEYWNRFFSIEKAMLELETMQYVVKDMCEKRGIKYCGVFDNIVYTDIEPTLIADRNTTGLCNHLSLNGHKMMADLLLSKISK